MKQKIDLTDQEKQARETARLLESFAEHPKLDAQDLGRADKDVFIFSSSKNTTEVKEVSNKEQLEAGFKHNSEENAN